MRRAAKYRRISSDREGRELGIERQDEDLDALAQRRGLELVADYTDNDISASTNSRKKRPGYSQMLDDAKAGRFDVIAAYTTSRLTRRPREFEDLIDLATQHGIEFAYVRSPEFDLNTAAGRRIARTLAAHDAGQAEDISELVARQKAQKAAKGEWKGGRRPFGFQADGVTIEPKEAAALLAASERVLLGATMWGLAAEWNAAGIPTTTGKPWTSVAVRRVLIRPRNAGLMEHQGEIIGQAQWPAVVPEDIWRGVKAVLTDPSRRTSFSSALRWLGSGVFRCGICGNTLRPAVSGSLKTRNLAQKVYVCKPIKHLTRIAEGLDEFVEAVVIERLSRLDPAKVLSRPGGVDIAGLTVQAAAVRAQMEELAGLYAQRTVTAAQLVRGTSELQAQLDRVEAQMAEASRGSELSGVVGVSDVHAAWSALSPERKRAVVDLLMSVTVMPSPRGRRKGWKPGERYFDPATVQVEWK